MATSFLKPSGTFIIGNPDVPANEMFIIYFDWAKHFAKKGSIERTLSCLDKCLELRPNNSKVLYLRSLCKQGLALTKSALQDALTASEIKSYNAKISLQVCDVLHALNQFERSEVELYDNTRKYTGAIVRTFNSRLIATKGNLIDCLGESLVPFLANNQKNFPLVVEEIKRKRYVDKRPQWKIMKEQNNCDVLSIEEKKEKLISPLESMRRERWFRIFNQIYLGRNWVDKTFLHGMVNNKKWQIPTFMESTPTLKNILRPNYIRVKKFTKMLHARSPMYNESFKRFGNQKLLKKLREDYLYKTQYQTRRNMFIILAAIRNYRTQGNIKAMAKYIEHIMGDYTTTKTHRIMPRKFEFINEVYNNLGLAYADQFVISPDIVVEPISKDSLQNLLNVKMEVKEPFAEFIFGEHKTYKPLQEGNTRQLNSRKYLIHLEERLAFAKYWIEKCYLWHEISRINLEGGMFAVCISAARKAIEASKQCNSNLWAFLSIMLIIKALAAQHKVENCQEALIDATKMAYRLKDFRLIEFVQLANTYNEHELDLKKQTGITLLPRRRWYGLGSSQISQMTYQSTSGKSLISSNK